MALNYNKLYDWLRQQKEHANREPQNTVEGLSSEAVMGQKLHSRVIFFMVSEKFELLIINELCFFKSYRKVTSHYFLFSKYHFI